MLIFICLFLLLNKVYANCGVDEVQHTNIDGEIICTKKLATVLQSGQSQCGQQGELNIWVNTALAASEIYTMASDSWSIGQLTVSNNLNIPTSSIKTEAINNNAITNAKMSTNSVANAQLVSGSVTADKIASNAVGSSQLMSNSVTADKIAANSIGNSELKTSSSFTIGDGYTFTAGYLTAGNGLKAADSAFEIIDDNVDGGSSCTMNLKGWIHITSSPRGDQTDGNYQTSNYVYYLRDSGPADETFNHGSWYDDAISIDAEGAILSSTYIGASDERIKKDIRALKDNESLDLLRQLDAKSYKYRDPIQRHPGETIGFIAQDVKKTIPAAVTTLTRIIPNEMRIITVKFKKITADSWKMTLNEEISPGTYRFVFETLDDKQVVKDLTTEDGKTFEVERQYKKEAVLYGKEVDDFLTIDKQKIFAVAYSALQQVDKNQQVLQKKVKTLEATIKSLTKRLDALESK